MGTQQAGLLIAIAGAILVLAGLAVWSGAFSWFGRLPGDIRIEREGLRVYVPLVSMALLSLALTALLWIVQRVFR